MYNHFSVTCFFPTSMQVTPWCFKMAQQKPSNTNLQERWHHLWAYSTSGRERLDVFFLTSVLFCFTWWFLGETKTLAGLPLDLHVFMLMIRMILRWSQSCTSKWHPGVSTTRCLTWKDSKTLLYLLLWKCYKVKMLDKTRWMSPNFEAAKRQPGFATHHTGASKWCTSCFSSFRVGVSSVGPPSWVEDQGEAE